MRTSIGNTSKRYLAWMLTLAAAATIVACGGGGGSGGSGSSASLSGEAGNIHDLSGQVRFSTTAPQAGEMLEISGADLEPIALLDIAGIRLSPEKRRDTNGETVLRITMPRLTLAENQPVDVVGYGGDGRAMKLSSSAFTWCPVAIDRLSSATASPGMAVELSGACLDRAAQVRWGGMDVPILRRSARGVVIALDATQSASHRVEVRTASGFALNGPTLDFNTGLAPGLRIDPMIGQVNLLPAASPMLRLIPGKTAMVMARISRPYGISASRASARVELLNALGTRFASYPLQGDDAFPDVPGPDNAMENNYFTVIPPDQVANIRTVRIVADDSASNLTQSVSFQPPVAPSTSFRLHLVPIARPGGAPAPLPDPRRVQAVLSAMFPVSGIEVVAHAPVTFSGSSDAFSQKDLFDLTALRAQEGAQNYEFYFGVQPESRNAGLAYVGGNTATGFHTWPTNTKTSSLFGGADAALITELIAHEVTHNFGRTHTFEDSSYPYANGGLGTYAGLSLFQNSPSALPGAQWYDVMSYSAPKWFSDYSANGVQRNAELRALRVPTAALAGLRTDSALQPAVAPVVAALRLLEISGDPASGNLSLHSTLDHAADTLAAQPVPDALRRDVNASLWVRIGLVDGSTQWFVPTVRSVSDGDTPAVTAALHLPAATAIASVALVRDGTVVRTWSPARNSATAAPVATLQESAGRITVRWDPQYRLSLVYQSAKGTRSALAVNLTDGQVTLNAPTETGGSWMWTLTDGLALHQGNQRRAAGI